MEISELEVLWEEGAIGITGPRGCVEKTEGDRRAGGARVKVRICVAVDLV